MALHMNLMVNGQQIGYLYVQRREPVRPTGEDICAYDWRLNVNGETRSNVADSPVKHRFGDGAWALVSKVVEAAGHGPRESA